MLLSERCGVWAGQRPSHHTAHTRLRDHAQGRFTRRQVTLAYGEGDARPQFVMTEHPGEPPDGEPIKLDQIGISHLSFTVPSVAQLTQQLLAKGYKTSGSPDAFQDQSGRVRTVFFCDPDGILVQFDEGSGG